MAASMRFILEVLFKQLRGKNPIGDDDRTG